MDHDYKTIYEITTDAEYAGGGTYDLDTEDDHYLEYHYTAWNIADATTGDLAKELAAHFINIYGMFADGVIVHMDDEGRWYLVFSQENIDAYFRNMHRWFIDAAAGLDQTTEKELKGYYPKLDAIQKIFSDDSGDMINEAEHGWMTPQDFMRFVRPGVRYYICGAIDAYH